MAFNISITKTGKINWEELNTICSIIDRDFATIFPIQENNFYHGSGVGISINANADISKHWNKFESLIIELNNKGFEVVELYDGKVIDSKNLNSLEKMLKG